MIERYSRPEMKRVWSDDNAYALWLRVEIAACQAWCDLGVVPPEDMALIRGATFNRASYDRWFEETKHDLVSFTRAVSESLGPESRWVHYGLTSNDVKDTALAMQMTEACDLIDGDISQFLDTLERQAVAYKDTPCIGRSHGVHAEPMSFGLKLALWHSEMGRNRQRLAETRSRVNVGMISGPVGTYAGIPPEIEASVCEQLGLTPVAVSNQIIQRDRHAEFVQTLALIGATLEKVATEIRALQRTEVREVQEPFGEPGYVTKGSSSMPHKRNPELSERVCGLARLVRGYAQTALENVALWHERDISHSSAERMALPDAALAIDYMLELMTGIIGGMRVDTGQMMRNLELTRGLVFSPRVMLALVEAGMDRAEAYDLVQEHTMRSWDGEEDFRDLLRADTRVTAALPGDTLESLFDYGYYLGHVDHIYEAAGITPTPVIPAKAGIQEPGAHPARPEPVEGQSTAPLPIPTYCLPTARLLRSNDASILLCRIAFLESHSRMKVEIVQSQASLAASINVSLPTLKRILHNLREREILRVRRTGSFSGYSVNYDAWLTAFAYDGLNPPTWLERLMVLQTNWFVHFDAEELLST